MEAFIRRRCIKHLESGKVVVLAGGTGNPFSTDTCGARGRTRSRSYHKSHKVDGVYTDDPMKNPDARLIENITYQQVLEMGLKVMDPAAISLCSENNIPVVVLNIFKVGSIEKTLRGEKVGTLIAP